MCTSDCGGSPGSSLTLSESDNLRKFILPKLTDKLYHRCTLKGTEGTRGLKRLVNNHCMLLAAPSVVLSSSMIVLLALLINSTACLPF